MSTILCTEILVTSSNYQTDRAFNRRASAQLWQPLYDTQPEREAHSVAHDCSYPLHGELKLLPSVCRFLVLKGRTKQYRNSFVPSAILRLNRKTTRWRFLLRLIFGEMLNDCMGCSSGVVWWRLFQTGNVKFPTCTSNFLSLTNTETLNLHDFGPSPLTAQFRWPGSRVLVASKPLLLTHDGLHCVHCDLQSSKIFSVPSVRFALWDSPVFDDTFLTWTVHV